MEVSIQEITAGISLQSIQAIKKEREKSIAKALSTPGWKDGKYIHHSKERHDNFQCNSANEAEARISSSDLQCWHTSMVVD